MKYFFLISLLFLSACSSCNEVYHSYVISQTSNQDLNVEEEEQEN